jgi:hypothetical protein
MHRLVISRYALLPLLVIFTLTLLYIALFYYEVFADSPSFARQQIKDNLRDWKDISTFNKAISGDQLTDIVRVHYLSNGENLNATLWLAAPFKHEFSNKSSIIVYGALIDADSNYATGMLGIDYRIAIIWENKTKIWTKVFEEIESLQQLANIGVKRTLPEIQNYTGFFEYGKRYVDLSTDLDVIGSPDKFRIIFYALEEKQDSPLIVDFTNWAYIPPPEFILSTTPSPIELRQGDRKNIMVQLKSTADNLPLLVDNFTIQKHFNPNIIWDFNELSKSNNLEPASIGILVGNDAKLGTYTISILGIINATSSFPFTVVESPDFGTRVSTGLPPFTSGNLVAQVPLGIKVLEKLTPLESANDFFNKYGALATFIFSIITFIGGIFIDKYVLP